MTLETFFEKFELFADAPNAVAKMREVILRLAVQGRLVDSDSTDETVADLLKQLAEGKARRAKRANNTNGVHLEFDEGLGQPFETPAHWAWVPLNDIGTLSGGMTPSKNKASFWDGDMNWFSPKDIKSDELIDSELKITSEGAEATGLPVYPPGCLFMVARSGILKRTFPVSINRVEATANQDLKILIPFVDGMERYLQVMFRGMTDFILSSLVKTGMTVQSLKYEEFEVQPFPLPPLAEQKRIVAKVDELMALCDRLEAQQKERETQQSALARAAVARFADAPTPANIELLFHKSYAVSPADLRKTILALAVQGKLVPQDPSEEPGHELLKRIQAEKAQLVEDGILKKVDELFTSDEGPESFTLPDGWTFVALSELCTSITDGDHLPPPKAESGVPFLVISNVRWGGIDFTDCRYVPEAYFNKLDPIRQPQRGDILYTLVGSFGIPVVVNVNRSFCVQRHIGIIRPSSKVSIDFIARLLESDLVLKQASSIATGIAQKTVPLSGLRKIRVSLPPLDEQRRIVAKVDQLMALVDKLEVQLAASRAAATALMDALVAELTTAGSPDGTQQNQGNNTSDGIRAALLCGAGRDGLSRAR